MQSFQCHVLIHAVSFEFFGFFYWSPFRLVFPVSRASCGFLFGQVNRCAAGKAVPFREWHVGHVGHVGTCGSQFWEPDGPSPPKLGIIRIKCLKEHQQRQRWKLWHFHSNSYWNILKSYNHKFTTTLDLEDTGKPKSHRHIVRSCRLRWNGDKPIQRRKYRKW